MLSLLDLISQNQPHFQTHQALLVINLQNDFLESDGRLPVNSPNDVLERTRALVPKFRQLNNNVIWIQTLYEADRMANDPTSGEGDAVVVGGLVDGVESSTDDDDDVLKEHLPSQSRSARHKQRALDLLKKVSARRRTAPPEASQSTAEEDDELFLFRSSKKAPACLPGTPGADFSDAIKPVIADSDTKLRTTNYSAFLGTSLLLILRAKLVTELYICGCITNISVLATIIDAARHGIRINVVVDCLGYRKQNRHDEALKRMVDFLDANLVTSRDILDREPSESSKQPSVKGDSKELDDTLGNRMSRLQLKEGGPGSSRSSYHAPSITVNGRQRAPSDASYAESRMTTDTRLSDDQFAEMLTQGAVLPKDSGPPSEPKQKLVKSKIRMRPRPSNSKKTEEKKSKGEGGKKRDKGEPSARHVADTPTSVQTPDTQPPKSSRETADKEPRLPAVAKAESSDQLQTQSKRDKALKGSIFQPSLSTSGADTKEKKLQSGEHPASSRTSKSESHTMQPNSSRPSSAKTTKATEIPRIAPAKTTKPEAPQKSSTKTTVIETPPKSPTKIAPGSPLNSPQKPSSVSLSPPKSAPMGKKVQSLATFPVLRPGDRIAEGDSRIIYDFIPAEVRHPSDRSSPLKDLIFQQLYNEVRWQRMLHQQGEVPRLVCCQGEFGADGSMPVYRHPTDQVLPLLHFSPKVQVIRKQAEKIVGHPLNHALIQLYRSGTDYISEHSDKTLDIVQGSSIVNVSFGAQRTMRLRTKKSSKSGNSVEGDARNTQRVAMPHNSMFVLGLESNKKWLHGINTDKRLEEERSEEERAYSGMRISLTFRHIGTFIDAENGSVWGQGATSKDQRDAQDVVNDDEDENERMVRAFSRENHNSDFDWDEWYGDGFDVLHFRNAPEDVPILFASNNLVETKSIQIFLAESKINHVYLAAPTKDKKYELDRQVCFRDNDVNHTEVAVSVPVLLYLDKYHPIDRDDRGRPCSSRSYENFLFLSALMKAWFNRHVPTYENGFIDILETLEERQVVEPGPFISGRRFAISDCSAWPAFDEIITNWDGWTEDRFPCLTEYYKMLWKKKKSVSQLRDRLPEIRKTSEEQAEEEE